MILSRIHAPFTALLFILIASVYAAPSGVDVSKTPQELTLDEFDQTVAEGFWWIKFYSPYCHHCKAFAPAWDRLYRKLKDKYENLHFASVNCVAQGDLCDKMDVGVYPTINLYNATKLVKNMKGIQEEDYLEIFIDKEINRDPNEATESSAPVPVKPKFGGTRTASFPTYPASSEAVNSKYPDSVDPKLVEDPADLSLPNPSGASVLLDHTDFTRRVTATRDGWFVQFYSPASKYTRNIQPAWDLMAFEAKGKLNIGQVNCQVETRLCKEAGITQFPTLKYFASSIQSEYTGLRGVGDLLQFLKRAYETHHPKELSFGEYKNLRKSDDDVTLLYLHNDYTAREDFQAFEKLAVAMIGTVDVAVSNDTKIIEDLKEDNLPALYVISKEKKVRFPEKTSSGLRDHHQLVTWAEKHRQPLVPQLTPSTYKDIFSNSKVILAILDPREEEATTSAMKELRAAAMEIQDIMAKAEREELDELRKKKQIKIDEARDKDDKGAEERASTIRVEVKGREPVSVAWIDGIFWERWVKGRYGSFDGHARVVINDERGGKFWDRTESGDILVPSRSSILETLEAVTLPSPSIKAVSLHNSVLVYLSETKENLVAHKTFYLIVVGVILFGTWYRRYYSRGTSTHRTTASEGLLGKQD